MHCKTEQWKRHTTVRHYRQSTIWSIDDSPSLQVFPTCMTPAVWQAWRMIEESCPKCSTQRNYMIKICADNCGTPPTSIPTITYCNKNSHLQEPQHPHDTNLQPTCDLYQHILLSGKPEHMKMAFITQLGPREGAQCIERPHRWGRE